LGRILARDIHSPPVGRHDDGLRAGRDLDCPKYVSCRRVEHADRVVAVEPNVCLRRGARARRGTWNGRTPHEARQQQRNRQGWRAASTSAQNHAKKWNPPFSHHHRPPNLVLNTQTGRGPGPAFRLPAPTRSTPARGDRIGRDGSEVAFACKLISGVGKVVKRKQKSNSLAGLRIILRRHKRADEGRPRGE
jgi:hypothetical protein